MLSVFVIGLQAQDKSVKLRGDNTYTSFSFDDGDIINASETYSIEVTANKATPLTQSMRIKLDSISGTPTVSVDLWGKPFDSDIYEKIGSTVSWTGTTADTTIHVLNATANRFRIFKTLITSDANVQNVAIEEFEFFVRQE